VPTIQSYGSGDGRLHLGFDNDREDIFDRLVEFIQKSGIPIAMRWDCCRPCRGRNVPLLRGEGGCGMRVGATTPGEQLNFLPHMDGGQAGGRLPVSVKQIYSSAAYYERVKLYWPHPSQVWKAAGG